MVLACLAAARLFVADAVGLPIQPGGLIATIADIISDNVAEMIHWPPLLCKTLLFGNLFTRLPI